MKNTKQPKPKQTNAKQTKDENCQTAAKCKNNHSSPMTNAAWTDLNSKGDILKLNDF